MQAAAAAVCAAAAGTGSVDWAYGTEGAESAVGDNHYKACWIGLTDSGGADAENRWRCVYPPSLRLPPKSVKLQPPPGGRGAPRSRRLRLPPIAPGFGTLHTAPAHVRHHEYEYRLWERERRGVEREY